MKTGAFNDTFVEITEGLQPGEEVLLNPPMFTEGDSVTDDSDERFGGREALEVEEVDAELQGKGKLSDQFPKKQVGQRKGDLKQPPSTKESR